MKIFSRFQIANRDYVPFDKSDYSCFKYGSKSVARDFGTVMGISLAVQLLVEVPRDVDIVISSSPYTFIPTASSALKDYIVATVNPVLIADKRKPLVETRIHRQIGYTTDYGGMSAEERRKMTAAEEFYTDPVFLKGKFVIFIDDVKITGVHQELMMKMIINQELEKYMNGYMFCYFGELMDPKSDATIEDHLNRFAVKNLLDLDKIIKNDEFIFNTRNVKYILNSPHIECVNFLEYQRRSFIESLYYLAIGNSYHLESKFAMNFKYLEHLINEKTH